ncbi:hypothetical protein QUC31_015592 [Theobroma cacao]|uniref:Exostosin family protein n=1 Tax=Theobroma cacao TaxID=3641 RepID=A0A061E5Y6_THECC|nr:Exostosin family protein [Theobroma cacao]
MSRCLPFPPPGYVRNGVSGEALLEQIKVQRERVMAEREKKKEKWRSKKEMRKEREQGEICEQKPGHHERHKRLRSNEGGGRSENQGKTEYGTQEMGSSGLTEELKQPISDSFYESSDNSRSIHKKRNSGSRNECGNIVQIDVQLQKHKTPEALSRKPDCSTIMMDSVVQKKLELPVEEHFSSASGVPATDVQEFVPPPLRELSHSSQTARIYKDEKSKMTLTEQFRELEEKKWLPRPLQIEQFDVGDQEGLLGRKPPRGDICETSNASSVVLHHGYSTACPYDQHLLHSLLMLDSGVQKKLELDPTPVQEQLSSDCVPATDEKCEMAPTSSCSEISLLQIESQFRELVANWLPPSLQSEHFDIGDQDWLFETKQPRSNIRDKSKASYDVLHQGDFTRYPRAQYLPQANIHALPYAVPY